MAYNLEPRTIKENLLGLIGNNPYAEPRPAKTREECFLSDIAENGGGLPKVTSEDNGDVLAVVDGAWDKAAPTSQLPAVTSSDNGNVLTVVDGVWDKAAPAGGLPQFVPDQHTVQVTDEVNGGTRAFDPSSDELVAFLSGSSATIAHPCFNDPPSGLCYIAASGLHGISYAVLAMKSNFPTTDTVSDDPEANAAFVYSDGDGTNLAFFIDETTVTHILIDPAKIKYCRCLPK